MCVCVLNDCFPVLSSVLLVLEWHQYDDIVCAKPSEVKKLWTRIARDKNKDVVEGKIIAANIMLESIFSILGTWNPNNLRNFLFQLRQFHVVTSNPRVHDGREMLWTELNFGTQQVICFLLTDTRKETVGY